MTRHDIYETKPASVYANRWRDCTPLGNGLTGAALFGGAMAETVVISRADLWYGAQETDVPDVSSALTDMRTLQVSGKTAEACNRMFDALTAAGYGTKPGDPRALGCVRLQLDAKGVYSHYRRILHLDTAEAEIRYQLDNVTHTRTCFVSRRRDVTVVRIHSSEISGFSLTQGFFDSFEGAIEQQLKQQDAAHAGRRIAEGCLLYSSQNEGKYFGLVTKVLSNGRVTLDANNIRVTDATESLILIKAFSNKSERRSAEAAALRAIHACPTDYRQLFAENKRLYASLYNKADVKLYTGRTFHSNEQLLADAMNSECAPELIEKLWRFGRYLFISGVAKSGQPFPLYGLWSCGYERHWAQHVGNENVQMIHWHAAVGGLESLVEPLINFYHSKTDGFRRNAKNLFGCNGIFAGAYLSPGISHVSPHVPVILHFLGVAGWISRHFYEYYLCTQNEKIFCEKILPFMVETAAFYEDYVYENAQGDIELYPACSPENTPLEFQGVTTGTHDHPMPVTKNPTVEFAILKELLTNLVSISRTHPALSKKAETWKAMLARIPDYVINEDGALAEWMDGAVHDYYAHRHLSHLYPLFPGTEIEDTGRHDLLPAFRKAVELRELGHMTGWSLMHMAAIHARLKDKDNVFRCFNMLAKVCLLDNFFTLHNDYRDMGITTTDMGNEAFAPVQLDALLGAVNAVQEMLLYVSATTIKLLPACPETFAKGSASLFFFDGTVKLRWSIEDQAFSATFKARRDTFFRLELPFDQGVREVSLKAGETAVFKHNFH
ncbi:MAG: glycoside hydrolase N-terminal domain-containing protein [Clostridia bacterium]|nr:glycoside hydrolase N-terminal domain-containing protein [Clostridia bacterium]